MKKTALSAILFAGTLAFLAPRPADAAWSVSISYFQQELSPYGSWYVTSRYGRVWCPRAVSAGWYPYLDGEWIYTDYGWTWVSFDPFGDDPFHYGTWVWIEPYRWCWVPGYVWAPAWVTWAWTDSYVGWAPVPPSLGITAAGYSGAAVSAPQSSYVFVPTSQFAETNIARAHVPVGQNAGILAHARRVTRFTVSGGIVHGADPPPAIIERASGRPVHRAGLAVAGHTIRPTAITSAHAGSASRFSIVAPAHERAVAQGPAAASGQEKRIAHGTSPSGGELRHEICPAVVEQPRRSASVCGSCTPRCTGTTSTC